MEENGNGALCGKETEVFSRIVGYFRPIKNWNEGKREEYGNRMVFSEKKAAGKHFEAEVVKVAAR